ncbi:hypothetical protein UFOVP328_82 [uncultured Caudovirales phage]|uniref:Uncharacterized protein n=1 Tax=uncultured Caudovirales phage TaxID=2100421 RepID=A0A6J5LUF6_9CAUD|nr:hypothetical protein UFOVP328_82 [uncultured Caudovirales phage]
MTKELLFLIQQHHLPFKTVASDRWFYDHWQYCISFYLEEVNCLRGSLESADIQELLESRNRWREKVRSRWPHNNFVHTHRTITDDVQENVCAFAEFLKLTMEPYKMVVSVDRCWIYTNDTNLLERIDRLPMVRNSRFSRAQIVRPKNTIAMRKPQHEYRSYFRSVKLFAQEKQHLVDFLNSQTEVRTSPAFQDWANSPFNRTQDYFFVDHNSQQWLTMMSLVRPGLIRRTVQIIAK